MIKKLTTGALTIGLLVASVVPTFAVQNGCGNGTTGPSSNNICNTVLSKLHSLDLNFTGSVSHSITQNSTSGHNKSNNNTINTGNLTVNSGNASVDISSIAGQNSGNVTVNQSDSPADNIGTNNITGPSSNNTVGVTDAKSSTTNLTMGGSISHSIVGNAISGFNKVNMNTALGGGIMTGFASGNISVGSSLNSFDMVVNQ